MIAPTYDLTLPSDGRNIKFRPFLVKEEKILLMALEGNDEKEMINAIRQIISNCSVTPLDADSLPIFDLEYFFLKLRAKSVGEVVTIPYKCQNILTEDTENGPQSKQCGTIVPIDIHLDQVEVTKPDNHTNVIMLTDTIGVKMRYPRIELIKQMGTAKTNIESAINLVAKCVESVFDADNVYDNSTFKELIAFLESLTQPQFNKIQEFFDTMPAVRHTITFQCPSCGYSDDIMLEGMESFFV